MLFISIFIAISTRYHDDPVSYGRSRSLARGSRDQRAQDDQSVSWEVLLECLKEARSPLTRPLETLKTRARKHASAYEMD